MQSQAQDKVIYAKHYGVDEGLSHRAAHCVFEDAEGFIWVGTEQGLNRFDGEEFRWYSPEHPDFDFDNISRIAQDREGWLWLWNDEGFLFFHPQSEEMLTAAQRFGEDAHFQQELKKEGSWKYWERRHIPTDSTGRFYLESDKKDHFVTYHPTEGFKQYHIPDLDSFQLLNVLDNGHLIFENKGRLLKFDAALRPIERTDGIKGASKIIDAQLINGKSHVIYEPRSDYPTSAGAFLINDRHEIIPSPSTFIHFNTTTQHLWGKTKDAWTAYSLGGSPIVQLANDDSLPDEVFNYTNHFYSDSKGRVWLATDMGLTLLRIKDDPFRLYFTNGEERFPINNSIRGIWKEGGEVFANLEMGGFCQASANGDWELLDQTQEDKGSQIGANKVNYWGRALHRGKDGTFWIGGRKSLIAYKPLSKGSERIFLKGHTESDHPIIDIWHIHEDGNGRLWLGTGNGLLLKNPDENFIRPLPDNPAHPELREAVLLHIVPEGGDAFWLCTNKGLYLFNHQTQRIQEHYWTGGSGRQSLPENDIKHLHKDREGIYWLASASGLIRWDRTTGGTQVFDRRHNLPDNNVYGILEDEGGYLWFGTDKGLVRFGKRNHEARVFTRKDNLPHEEFNRTSFHSAADGTFLLGTMNGIVAFDPAAFSGRQAADYQLKVSGILAFNGAENAFEDISPHYWRERRIVMDDETSFFTIDFSLLDYGLSGINRYKYQLEGFSPNWVDLEESKVRLNKLPYGEYILKVKAFTNGTTENADVLRIPISVPAPFYLSVWFFVLMTLLAISLVVLYFWMKARRQRERQRELEHEIAKANRELQEKYQLISEQKTELEQANYTKDRIFAILGHDLRKPANSFRGIARRVNYLIHKQDYTAIERISQSMERDALGLTTLTDNLLNWALSQRDALPIRPEALSLQDTVDAVFLTLGSLAKDKDIALETSLPVESQVVADRHSLQTIIRNLVDNAIKFTPRGGSVHISAEAGGLIIQDTGVGIPKDKLAGLFQLKEGKTTKGTDGENGTGLGLHLVHELVLRNNGTISVKSEEGLGTRFLLRFPK